MLPSELFNEFAEYDHITWNEFMEAYRNQELNHYAKSVEVILTYGKNTMKAIEYFQVQLDSKHTPEEADFILTTCHSAKGLEWDHVELCDDFLSLQKQSYVCNVTEQPRPPFMKYEKDANSRRLGWQFGVQCFGDDLNLIYVACTRAKKTLSLPRTIESLLRDLDTVHFYANDLKNSKSGALESEESAIILPKEKRRLNKGELWALYQDVCVPIRKELGIQDDSKIMNHLFGVADEDIDQDEEHANIKDEEQEQSF